MQREFEIIYKNYGFIKQAKHYDKQEKRQLCLNKLSQLKAYIKDYKYVDIEQLKCMFVCVNSNMFRGCLHPSPVADLIVGNISRGRKLKGDICSEKLSHRYLFDATDRLVRIETVHQGKVTYIEDLFYTGNSRVGITSYNGKVYNVCEEVFENNHIVSAAILSCYELDRDKILLNLHWEEYGYDEKGLFFCDFVTNFNPDCALLNCAQYAFVIEDGLLKSYTNRAGRQYNITKKRNAQGKGFYFP